MSSQQPMDSISQKIDELVKKALQNGPITTDELCNEMPDELYSSEEVLQAFEQLEARKLLNDGDEAFVQDFESTAAEADDSDPDPTDALKLYMKTARQYRLLTTGEMEELSRRILENHDEAAQEELINHNLRLVVPIARQYQRDNMPLLDLIQEGNIGLQAAAKTYDYRKGRFSTYATIHIKWALHAYHKSMGFDRKINAENYQDYKRIKELIDTALKQGYTVPDVSQIMEALSLSRERVLSALSLMTPGSSLNSAVGNDEDSDGTLLDFVPNRANLSPDEQALTALDKDSFSSLLENMIPRHALALRFYYEGYTDEAAARELELSKEQYIRLREHAILQFKISDRYKKWKDRRKHD